MKDELEDAIMEGGVEMLAEAKLAEDKDLGAKVKAEAVALVKAVDPTGIADLVDAFEADPCTSKVIPAMPVDGLEAETPEGANCDTIGYSKSWARCGPSYGICTYGYCSKWNWCGWSSAHKNKQQDYDYRECISQCDLTEWSESGMCGPDHGVCRSGYCSKWNWCGWSSAHQNKQTAYDAPSGCSP